MNGERYLKQSIAKLSKRLAKEIAKNPKNASIYIGQFANSKTFMNWATKLTYGFVSDANKKNKRWWKHTQHSKGKKLGYNLTRRQLEEIMNENFRQIKSIPERLLSKMSTKMGQKLYEQVLGDTGKRNELYKFLLEKGAKNAKLIARTETAKINTKINQMRSSNVGSIAYVWRTSNDQRVRESHKNMNKVVVFWDDKPVLDGMTGHAGEYPNCRCQTIPIIYIDDFLEDKSVVKVYRHGQIKSMSPRQFKKLWVEKGGRLQ